MCFHFLLGDFMKIFNLLLCLLTLSLVSCAEIGLKPHKPSLKSTAELSKSEGLYQILFIKGANADITKILNGDLLSCGTTTFSMPRGNTVGTFMREVFEQELNAAKKLSLSNGTPIEVVVKKMNLITTNKESGEWTVEVDYTMNDKTTTVKTVIEFESKVSLITSCSHTANVFEDALADNLVEYFKRTR